MDTKQGQAIPEDKVKSFVQGKWFPVAIAGLALAITFGGHAFTATNAMSFVKASNKIESLEASLAQAMQANEAQDRAIQTLQAHANKSNSEIQQLNQRIEKLIADSKTTKSSAGDLPAGYQSVREEAFRQAEAAQSEKQPLANGVNERFDALIRSRMKPHWDQFPARVGEDKIDDEDMVVLQFQVDRQGLILDVQVANTSGQIELDNSAVKAALRMNSIPEIAGLNDQAYAQIRNFRLAITPAHMK